MVEITSDLIVLQNELSINLTTTIIVETHLNGHHAYKEIWMPKQNEHLGVRCEPENPVDKYDACVLKGKDIVGHLKKGDTGRFAKTIHVFYFIRKFFWPSTEIFPDFS